MEEVEEKRLQITDQVAKEVSSTEATNSSNQTRITQKTKYKSWFRIVLYIIFLLLGQLVALLLGRLYFDKGGKSKWLGTLVQLAGFPILLPYYIIPATKKTSTDILQPKQPTVLKLASFYVSLGLLLAADCYLFSVGLMYLPVSTYSLICSSQLAFNALFSFFLNSQKFTPFIINSLVLLTISSTLLVFQTDSEGSVNKVSKGKYFIGFICTVAASAGYGLVLSLTQLFFNKVIKTDSFKAVVDMAVFRSFVACVAVVVGLFASGEWRGLKREMNEFELGKVSYIMTVVWTAILWKVYTVGCVGLIFEVSSLFSNAICTLGLPLVPIAAVIFFHDKMSGLKAIAMVLAVWGFVSYVYQQYLDYCKSKAESRDANKDPKVSSYERRIDEKDDLS